MDLRAVFFLKKKKKSKESSWERGIVLVLDGKLLKAADRGLHFLIFPR